MQMGLIHGPNNDNGTLHPLHVTEPSPEAMHSHARWPRPAARLHRCKQVQVFLPVTTSSCLVDKSQVVTYRAQNQCNELILSMFNFKQPPLDELPRSNNSC